MHEAVALAVTEVAERRPLRHAAVSAAKVVTMQADAALSAAVESAGLVTVDGQAIVWAACLLGWPLPERVTGIDLMDALLTEAAGRGYRVFFLRSESGRP